MFWTFNSNLLTYLRTYLLIVFNRMPLSCILIVLACFVDILNDNNMSMKVSISKLLFNKLNDKRILNLCNVMYCFLQNNVGTSLLVGEECRMDWIK